jgi:Zn-dependent peptidase ImmA (M78 family)
MAILTTKRRLEIEALTRELFERYHRYVGNLCGEEMSPRACLPVQVDVIISKLLKIPLRRIEEIPNPRAASTAGIYDGDVIVISESQHIGPQRFTAGHELGHAILHPGECRLRERPGTNGAGLALVDPKELEADVFSANLLMPRELVVEEFAERFGIQMARDAIDDDAAFALTAGKLQPSQIQKMSLDQFGELLADSTWFDGSHFTALSDVFGVSSAAMRRRLKELTLLS